jgi:V8-like Glu-specific endopeptidase
MGVNKVHRPIDGDDSEAVHILPSEIEADRAVCRVEIRGQEIGTGFLLGKNRVFTNQHVLENETMAREATFRFGFAKDETGVTDQGEEARAKVGGSFRCSVELDYAAVEIDPPPGTVSLSEVDIADPAMHAPVAVIGHPTGGPMRVSRIDSAIIRVTPAPFIGYRADTDDGTSGAPVFDLATWKLIALHHASAPRDADHVGNEGVAIRAVLADL